jgi:hypothetical protein
VLHQTEGEYCTITGFTAQSKTSTSADTPVIDPEGVDKLGKTLEGLSIKDKTGFQGGRINIENQELYRRTSAKVLYTISICIDPLDGELIREFAIVKEKWN